MPDAGDGYAATPKQGREERSDALGAFLDSLPHRPDDFQVKAAEALDASKSVLVAAPTGAGKTVVAECAIALSSSAGTKVFYTTPIKALSNQKFRDLRREYGPDRVGLLTGDNSINADAPIVVMTTEVLRNMLYEASSRVDGLGFVILDEVHYLQDPYRGSTWEEVIIHLPQAVRLVCLSATVGNVDEFGEWLAERRGAIEVVQETTRPVPLYPLFGVEEKRAGDIHFFPIFDNGHEDARASRRVRQLLESGGRRPERALAPPSRVDVVDELHQDGRLPAIYFIFSRAGCDRAVRSCLRSGIRLTSPSERKQIRAAIESRLASVDDSDLEALGFREWSAALEAGIAPHHAGLVPAFKEVTEELFNQALVRVVFATETLALGVNMPARTVVIESLSKFNGKFHALLTPAEFTQLSGRAGRRGIDEVGYCVTLFSRWVSFERIAEIAASSTFNLRSSFQPTYNMATNLILRHDAAGAAAVLDASFAQFQALKKTASLRMARDRRRVVLDRNKSGEESPRADRYRKEISRLDRRIARQEQGLARQFEAIIRILEGLDYLRGWSLTRDGDRLASIYSERDILVTETLRRCNLAKLRPPEVAAVVSHFTFEGRGDEAGAGVGTANVSRVSSRITSLWQEISTREGEENLELTPPPDERFAETAYRWASGERLETILEEEESAGDLVRNVKQVADLCRQIAEVTGDLKFREAASLVDRGIVAYSSL